MDVKTTVVSMERAALDRWGKGDPWGYTEIYADEITYFDPELDRRLDGLEGLRQRYAPLEGKLRIDRYEMINPQVQVHGDTAVLSFNLIDHAAAPDGTITTGTWNSTEVYARIGGKWRIIHSHWSKPTPRE
jgi:ketosteroid isomerase-like protein